MPYQLEVTPAAKRQIKKLVPDIQRVVLNVFDVLTINPRPRGVQKMQGEEDLYRTRIGDYRIIYKVHDDKSLIIVTKVGHRKDIYR